MVLVARPVHGLVLVNDAVPQAVVYASSDAREAAAILVRYVGRISGASLAVETEDPPAGKPAILIGRVAVKAGLTIPGPTPSHEGYAIRADGDRLLIAGESPIATRFAVFHFLQTLGCRWFMPGELGEVVPSLRTIEISPLDIREKPDFDCRRISGSGFKDGQWGVANRTGGMAFAIGHAWQDLVPKRTYFKTHPEYYALVDGQRRPSQLCTSTPDVVKAATETVLARFRSNPALMTVSLSPNDGGGFCECENCRKLDVAGYTEPSYGAVCLSDRLQVFYNSIAREVGKEFPGRILGYYAYADYTLPPKRETRIEPNLMVWIAPIRQCRLHGIGSPNCRSRAALGKLIDDWGKIAPRIGYRTYNFNLAECIAPYSTISIWKQEIPFLKAHKCTAANFETLGSWATEGPHIYLSARLAWDADADVDAIMADYYEKFCGKAAPYVRSYWERIDRAFQEADTHAGGFHCLPRIYTPELLAACSKDLAAAESAADSELVRLRVLMFRRGFENARMYMHMHDAFNAGGFADAKQAYEKLLAHANAMADDGILNRHGVEYLQRFIEPRILAGCARSTGERKVIARLPDEWGFRYDPSPEPPTDGWQAAKTYSATLEEQGIGEQAAVMWYAARVSISKMPDAKLLLWFAEIDGSARVWVNGKPAGESKKARVPFDLDVSQLLKAGENHIAVRVDHTHPTELALGGIIGPAVVYSSPIGAPAAQAQPKAPQAKRRAAKRRRQ